MDTRVFMKRNRTFLFFAMVAASSLIRGGTLHGQSESVDEEKALKVKAAYLLNFTKFVTWPADVFQDEHSPIIIGIAGTDPFGPLLDQTIKDKTVSGRELKVQRFQWRVGDDLSAVKKCHLLYVSSSLGDDTGSLVAALSRLPILLIGEGTELAKSGGTLGFVMEEGRIVFWVNKKAAETAKLQLSSQLLKLARPFEGVAVGQDRETPKGKTGD
jgi:hypothetical protein